VRAYAGVRWSNWASFKLDAAGCTCAAGVRLLCGYVTVAYFYATFTLWRSLLSSNK
jgi:hypothetical protein